MQLPTPARSKDRVLTDAQLVTVWLAADAYPFGHIVRLLILTGQRRGEITALREEYIDEKNKTITLPASLTKNNRAHTFPYGPMVAAILERTPRLNGYLFPARGNSDRSFSGFSASKAALDEVCKIEPWTLHDLRRTFSTNLAAIGIPPHVTERILNHSTGTISGFAAIYNRFQYMDEMRAAFAAWETRLASLLAFDHQITNITLVAHASPK